MKERSKAIPVVEYQAESIDEFLDLLNKRNKIWENGFSKNLWIYRGQWENTLLELKPKSLRRNLGLEDKSVKDYLMQEPLPNGSNIEDFSKSILTVYENRELHLDFQSQIVTKQAANRIKEIIKQSLIEILLIKKFIVACNNSALYLQDTKIGLRGCGVQDHFTSEKAILFLHEPLGRWLRECLDMELSCSMKSYPPFFEYLNYYPLALAQHSGIPTRLLDWTRSPLIAAFFAACERINNKNKTKGKICVYAFDIQYQDDYITYPNSLRIHRDLTHNEFEFLHAQKGILTEMRGADFYYFKHGKWPSFYEHIAYFDRSIQTGRPLYNLKKISISDEFTEELLKQLEIEDITKATLMPTYFHCAEYVLKK